MTSYTFTAIEHAEDPTIGSVCATLGDDIYEDPNNAGIDIEEAREVAEGYETDGISDEVIEAKWTLVS